MIWVQQAADARATKGFQVKVVARVGIRIYLAVGRGGAPPTNFAITSITGHRSAKGQPSIVADVDNTGGRAVDLNGTASLTAGPGGTSAGPFPGKQIITLAPGQSGHHELHPAQVPARRSLAGQGDHGERAHHQYPHADDPVRLARPSSAAALPIMAWAGIAVVLVLVVAFFVVRHAREHRRVPA